MNSSHFPLNPPSNFPELIPDYIERARILATHTFGPLDNKWRFSRHWTEPQKGPMMSPNFEYTTYSIRLTERAMRDWWACMHEIGHEATHTLAPVRRCDDTNLEEGAACIMAIRFRHHITGNLVSGPVDGEYAEPFRLVSRLLERDPTIIARVRSDGRRFRDISPADLRQAGSTLSHHELDFLCSVF